MAAPIFQGHVLEVWEKSVILCDLCNQFYSETRNSVIFLV